MPPYISILIALKYYLCFGNTPAQIKVFQVMDLIQKWSTLLLGASE